MAGNKALEKFKNSKIPKKGNAKSTVEIPIYKEPNTKSQIIGTIKKYQIITWISKSICDEREWIRCNNDNNYGYIVGYEKDGKCNLDIGTIKENKEETKKEYGTEKKDEIVPITKEEINLGNEALQEILNDNNDKKDDENNESKTFISTEYDENNKSYSSGLDEGKSQTGIKIEEDNDWDDFFENDINKIQFIKSENEKLVNEIVCQMQKEESNNNNSNQKGKGNSVSQAIDNLEEDMTEKEKQQMDKFLEDLHNASIIQRKENLKNNTNIEKVKIDGKMYPLDYSDTLGDWKNARRCAKRLNNIPKNDQGKKGENFDRRGLKQPGEVYHHKVIKDGVTENIDLRNDCKGHVFDDGTKLPPHFNDSKGRHIFYKAEDKKDKKKDIKKK